MTAMPSPKGTAGDGEGKRVRGLTICFDFEGSIIEDYAAGWVEPEE
jgi:hypothetical protein